MVFNHKLQAIVLAMAGSAILSLIDNLISLVAQESGLWQFQVMRTLFTLPLIFIIAYLFKVSLKPVNLRRVIMRSLIISVGLLVYFSALGILPVAEAGAGLYSAPFWVVLFSVVWFGGRITLLEIFVMTIGFIGVILLLQPDFTDLSVWSWLPIVSGAFYGFGMLSTRHWCPDESPLLLASSIFLSIGVLSLFVLIWLSIWPLDTNTDSFVTRSWKPITWTFLGLTIVQSVGAVIAVICLTNAYRIGKAESVAVTEYSFLIFAALWAYWLWGTTTNALAILGIVLIVISGMVLAYLHRE